MLPVLCPLHSLPAIVKEAVFGSWDRDVKFHPAGESQLWSLHWVLRHLAILNGCGVPRSSAPSRSTSGTPPPFSAKAGGSPAPGFLCRSRSRRPEERECLSAQCLLWFAR